MVSTKLTEKEIIRTLPQRLAQILPDVTIEKLEAGGKNDLWDVAIRVRVGRFSKWLRCDIKSKGEPLYLYQAIGRLSQAPEIKKSDHPVIITPYISKQGRKVCKDAGVGYIDLSGNAFLKFESVLIEKTSDEKNVPKIAKKPILRFPFTAKASRVLRVILERPKESWTFPTLSKAAQVNIRMAFLVIEHLCEKGFVDKRRGAITLTKPGDILDYWAENYSFRANEMGEYFSFARSFEEFLANLRKASLKKGFEYALTLHSGAALVAPYVRFTDVHLYVKGPIESWIKMLDLKPVEFGGTVHLMIPYDEGVFYNNQVTKNVSVACNTQLYIDNYSYPARGREQAEFLRKERMGF